MVCANNFAAALTTHAAPPTNESTFHQWTVGPIYYSALVVAEALGASNTSRVLDLAANSDNSYTPAYGIWENGVLARVLLINFANDPTGASTLQVDLSMPDGTLPSTVDVKFLLANNVTQKGNFTWAGQTYGGNFESDGRPIGTEDIKTTTCGVPTDGSSTTAVCRINVPAPGAALVFMTAFNELTVSALLWSSGVEPIGVTIFSMQYAGNSTGAAALSVLAIVVVLALALGLDRFAPRLPPGTLPWRS